MKTYVTHHLKKSIIMTLGLLVCALHQPAMALSLGYLNTVTNLDLSTSSLTGTVFTVCSTNSTMTNTVLIGVGQELRINGNVSVGTNVNNSSTLVTLTGPGSFIVNTNGGKFYVGGATASNTGNGAVVNMAGLGVFNANLGTSGVFRIGTQYTGTAGSATPIPPPIAYLATNSTITANILQMGNNTDSGTATLKLGAGENVLNANTITLANGRASGNMSFNTDSGTVKIRGTGGTDSDRATVNICAGLSGGVNSSASLIFSDHEADLLFDVVTMATFGISTSKSGDNTAAFSFSQGTLNINSILMGRLTGNSGSVRTVTASMNLQGGAVTVSNAIVMARNDVIAADTSAHTASATLTVSGSAKVSVFNRSAPSAPALELAGMTNLASSATRANGTLNITNGGILAVYGNIVDGGNSTAGGLATTTINLNSGALLMPNHAIVNVDNFTMTNATLAVGVYAGLPVLANRGTGILAPGGTNVVGSTIISNSYVQVSPATLDIDLVSKLSYDRVTVTGGVTLEGSIYVRAPADLSGEFDIVTSDTAITDTTVLTGASTGFTKTLVNDNKTLRLFKAPPGTLVSFL